MCASSEIKINPQAVGPPHSGCLSNSTVLPSTVAVTRSSALFGSIFEDDELLVVNKPAGLVCHPTKTDELSSLVGRVRTYLMGRPAHLVNRLDRETSGVVLIAKNQAAARELGRLVESRSVEKEYLAIVHGHPQQEAGVIEAALGKDTQSRVAIKDCVQRGGAPAVTEYKVEKRFTTVVRQLKRASEFALLRVVPRTGRKHQIRIHLAHIGHPIVGDKLYGGDEDLYMALVENRLTAEQRQCLILPYHALHAWRLRFTWRQQEWHFEAEPEPWFAAFAGGPSLPSPNQ